MINLSRDYGVQFKTKKKRKFNSRNGSQSSEMTGIMPLSKGISNVNILPIKLSPSKRGGSRNRKNKGLTKMNSETFKNSKKKISSKIKSSKFTQKTKIIPKKLPTLANHLIAEVDKVILLNKKKKAHKKSQNFPLIKCCNFNIDMTKQLGSYKNEPAIENTVISIKSTKGNKNHSIAAIDHSRISMENNNRIEGVKFDQNLEKRMNESKRYDHINSQI